VNVLPNASVKDTFKSRQCDNNKHKTVENNDMKLH